MQINRIGIRVSIFCITFLFGFLTVEWVVSNDDKVISNEIEQKAALKQSVESDRTPVEQSTTEPPCKEYLNQLKYNDLLNEEAKIKKLLADKIQSSQTRKSIREKYKTIERETETLEQFIKRLKSAERKRNGYHTLLYIENCAEYK